MIVFDSILLKPPYETCDMFRPPDPSPSQVLGGPPDQDLRAVI